ncbi:phage regulatory CII family protein [Acidovorax lacteus]|uniref:XRE family transcriptional regulator n=1 Tax=Acidovorax lacteus TaxID=1924988 RepID=A0ABP8L0S4_9BURK
MKVNVSIPGLIAYGEDEAVPSTRGAPDVLVAVANLLHGRVEQVAKRLGMSPSTLQKKVSLHTETHHLSVHELQLIQHVTGSIEPTQALAAAEGYTCVAVKPKSAGSVPEGLAATMRAMGDFAAVVAEATEGDGAVSLNDLRHVQLQLGELLGHANALAGLVASRVPQHARKGGGL